MCAAKAGLGAGEGPQDSAAVAAAAAAALLQPQSWLSSCWGPAVGSKNQGLAW